MTTANFPSRSHVVVVNIISKEETVGTEQGNTALVRHWGNYLPGHFGVFLCFLFFFLVFFFPLLNRCL